MRTRSSAREVAERFKNNHLPWKDMKWGQYPSLRVLPTPGDGSCIIHAIYGCLAPRHRDRMTSDDPEERKEARERVRLMRTELSQLVGEYYDDLPFKDFEDITVELDNGETISYDRKGLQKLIDSNRFLGEEFLVFLGTILSTNVIILDKKKQSVYMQAVTSHVYDNSRRQTVMILYDEEGMHFESAGLHFPNGHVVTCFDNQNNLLDPFKRMMKWVD